MFEQGDTPRAVDLLRHAYQVFRSQLGPEHPHTQSLARFFAASTTAIPDQFMKLLRRHRDAAQSRRPLYCH